MLLKQKKLNYLNVSLFFFIIFVIGCQKMTKKPDYTYQLLTKEAPYALKAGLSNDIYFVDYNQKLYHLTSLNNKEIIIKQNGRDLKIKNIEIKNENELWLLIRDMKSHDAKYEIALYNVNTSNLQIVLTEQRIIDFCWVGKINDLLYIDKELHVRSIYKTFTQTEKKYSTISTNGSVVILKGKKSGGGDFVDVYDVDNKIVNTYDFTGQPISLIGVYDNFPVLVEYGICCDDNINAESTIFVKKSNGDTVTLLINSIGDAYYRNNTLLTLRLDDKDNQYIDQYIFK